MKNFENILNIGQHEELYDGDKSFKELVEKLKKKESILVQSLESLNERQKSDFDIEILNPKGLSWGVFNSVEEDKEGDVAGLIDQFISTSDKEARKEIARKMIDLIE
jgi:hypothetical protein